jgi:adenylate kinase family enzyme
MPYIDGVWYSKFADDGTPTETSGTIRACVEVLKASNKPGWVSESGNSFKAVPFTESTLSPGIYNFRNTDSGIFFGKQQFPSDGVISLPGLPSDYVLNQIKLFWDKKDVYEKYGFIHKRGILLYGAPGSGKTSVARLLCNEIIKLGGIVFSIDNFILAAAAINVFRSVEPDRPILTLQEDIEGIFNGNDGPQQVKAALSFLDGQDQFNNIVHIATTNKPEDIADRFIKRPGRFDLVIGVKTPTEVTREAYFKHVCNNKDVSDTQLKELIVKTKGLELSYLREIASTFLCLGIPIDESVSRLKENAKIKSFKNADKRTEMGFVLGYDGEFKDK